VQALLPPEAPPPAAAEAAGRGSEQAARNTMKDARTTTEKAPWVPNDLRPDIHPSKYKKNLNRKKCAHEHVSGCPFCTGQANE
jgi:hypothetical protein